MDPRPCCEAFQGFLATNDIAPKLQKNVATILFQNTNSRQNLGKKATICDSDNPFLTSTKRHVFTSCYFDSDMTDQASMTLLLVLLHVYFLCKLRYIKQTIIQHLTHLLCSERLLSLISFFWYKGRHVVSSVMILCNSVTFIAPVRLFWRLLTCST